MNPVTGNVNEGSATVALDVEAQSPIAEQRDHNAEFLSGILFGVAAAALIAAIQEFVTSAASERRAQR